MLTQKPVKSNIYLTTDKTQLTIFSFVLNGQFRNVSEQIGQQSFHSTKSWPQFLPRHSKHLSNMFWLRGQWLYCSVHLVGVLLRVRVGFPGEADGARAPRAAAARLLADVMDGERARGHVTRGRPRGHRPGHRLHHHLAQGKIFVKIQKYFPGQVTW